MVFEKKQLSKVLAVALMVACAVAFMPLLNGQAFAAAKKPAKVKGVKATQVTNTMNVKVTWKKAKNAKKYQVKVGKKTYTTKKKTYTVKNLAEGTYKVKVRGINGKKKGKWSAAKKVTVVAPKTALKGVKISASSAKASVLNVGDTLTATVDPAEATADYAWARVSATGLATPIAGATAATYKIQADDIGSKLQVTATGNDKYEGSVSDMTTVAVSEKTEELAFADATQAVVGEEITLTKDTADSISITWYVGTQPVQSATDSLTYTPAKDDAGLPLTAIIKDKTDPTKDATIIPFGYVASKNIATEYKAVLYDDATGKEVSGEVAEGQTIYVAVEGLNNDVPDLTAAQRANLEYSWTADGKAIADETNSYLKIEKALVGKEIVVTVTSVPTTDNYDYAGVLTASTKTGSETVAEGYLDQGGYWAGETAKAKVYGTSGRDMSKVAELTWKYGAWSEEMGGGIVWGDAVSTGTNNDSLKITKDAFKDNDVVGVFATVGGKLTCLDYSRLAKADVDGIKLVGEDSDQLTVGKGAKAVLMADGFELTEAVEGTDFAVQYYAAPAGTVKEELYTDANKVDSITKALDANTAVYGVKLLYLKTSGKVFMNYDPEEDPEITADTTSAYYEMTVDITATRQGKKVEAEPYAVGDVLTAKTNLPVGTDGISYQWFRDDTAISDANTATYIVDKKDIGHTLKVVAKKELYNDAEKATSQVIVASTKLSVTTNPDIEAEVAPDLHVGDVIEVTQVSGNGDNTLGSKATYTWATDDNEVLLTGTGAEYASLIIPSAAYNNRLVLTVEYTGFDKYSFSTETVEAPAVVNPYVLNVTATRGTDTYAPYEVFRAGTTLSAEAIFAGTEDEPIVDADAIAEDGYQWYYWDGEEGEWVALRGQTGSSLTLTEDDYNTVFGVAAELNEGCVPEGESTVVTGINYAYPALDAAGQDAWMLLERDAELDGYWADDASLPIDDEGNYEIAGDGIYTPDASHFVFTLNDHEVMLRGAEVTGIAHVRTSNTGQNEFLMTTTDNTLTGKECPEGSVRCRTEGGNNPDFVTWTFEFDNGLFEGSFDTYFERELGE